MDFSLSALEDGTLTVSLVPPIPIGGFSMEYLETSRFGGLSGIVQKYMASGYYGVSGMNIVNSGLGVFSVQMNSSDCSGFDFGNHAYLIQRTDPGARTVFVEGYRLILPGPAY